MIPRTKNFSMEVDNFEGNIYESKRSRSITCNEVVIQQGYYTENDCRYDGFKQKSNYLSKKKAYKHFGPAGLISNRRGSSNPNKILDDFYDKPVR